MTTGRVVTPSANKFKGGCILLPDFNCCCPGAIEDLEACTCMRCTTVATRIFRGGNVGVSQGSPSVHCVSAIVLTGRASAEVLVVLQCSAGPSAPVFSLIGGARKCRPAKRAQNLPIFHVPQFDIWTCFIFTREEFGKFRNASASVHSNLDIKFSYYIISIIFYATSGWGQYMSTPSLRSTGHSMSLSIRPWDDIQGRGYSRMLRIDSAKEKAYTHWKWQWTHLTSHI